MSDYREELRVSKEILARVVEAYRKLRNTLRVSSSRISTTSIRRSTRVPVDAAATRWTVTSLARYARAGAEDARGRTTPTTIPTIFQTLNPFVTVDLSAFYVDVSKDRLYTFAAAIARAAVDADGDVHDRRRADAPASRRSCRSPPTSSGAICRRGRARDESVHLALFPAGGRSRVAIDADLSARWDRLTRSARTCARADRTAAQGQEIGNSLQARVVLTARRATIAALLAQHEAEPADAVHRLRRWSCGPASGRRTTVAIERARRREMRAVLADGAVGVGRAGVGRHLRPVPGRARAADQCADHRSLGARGRESRRIEILLPIAIVVARSD